MNTVALSALPLRRRRWPRVAAGLCVLLLALVAACEAWGWPFLLQPAQRWIGERSGRTVDFRVDGQWPASVVLRLLGGMRIEAPRVALAPSDHEPYAIVARDVTVSVSYADAWHAMRGEPLRLRLQRVAEIDLLATSEQSPTLGWQCRSVDVQDPAAKGLSCQGVGTSAAMPEQVVVTTPTWFDDVTKLLHNRPQSYMPITHR